jgi:glycosyltransferase involved in cell wall biosynthesis
VRLVSLSRQYPRLLFPGKTQTDESQSKLAFPNTERLVDSMNPISWVRAARQIKQQKPDLVIIEWWHPFFAPAFGTIAALCRRFSNVLFTCHNVLPHERSGPVKMLTRFALSKGDFFVVHSDEDAANLRSLLPNAALTKARHPTYEVFATHSMTQIDARKRLGLNLDDKVLLFFGLVREYKGLRYLIEAMPSILKSVDATLLIVGEFYEGREKYVQSIKDLGIESHVRLKDE